MTHAAATGRNAPDPLIDMADPLSEMTSRNHLFREQRVKAEAGVEFRPPRHRAAASARAAFT